jgi:hypothetical protein
MNWQDPRPLTLGLVLQALAACIAGAVLWRTWRAAASRSSTDRWSGYIVTLGFLARALSGVALFWISFLRLPVASTLQTGDGLWVYALDANNYMNWAHQAASRGPFEIVALTRTMPSVSFVQSLALAQTLFGNVASVAILLNCGWFLLMALLLRRWTQSLGPNGSLPGLFALAVVSFQPSLILWATQPLKDAFFGVLIVVWFYASRHWFDSFAAPGRMRVKLVSFGLLALSLYAIAGVRVYFAIMLWAAFGAAIALFVIQPAATRRLPRAIVGAMTWLLLSQMIVWSAEPYIPAGVRPFLVIGRRSQQSSITLLDSLVYARTGFVASGGDTQIRSGDLEGGDNQNRSRSWDEKLRGTARGLAATFLLRSWGRSLGLFDVEGGRGVWLFAEMDTFFFLLASVFSVALTARIAKRAGRLCPLAVQGLLSAAFVAVALAFVVTNFGTLFRLREMILLPLVLTPLAASGVHHTSASASAARSVAPSGSLSAPETDLRIGA